MNTWARLFSVVAATLVAVSMVSCGNDEAEESGQNGASESLPERLSLEDLPEDHCEQVLEAAEPPSSESLEYRIDEGRRSCEISVPNTYEAAAGGSVFSAVHVALQEQNMDSARDDIPVIELVGDSEDMDWEAFLRTEDRSSGCMGPEGDSVDCSTADAVELELFEFEFLAYYENIQTTATIQYWVPNGSVVEESEPLGWSLMWYEAFVQNLSEALPSS